jgi:serine/threonine protein kinase
VLCLDESAVASVYQSNIFDVTRKKDAPLWIITDVVSDLTFEDFVNKCKAEITFHKALLLTRQILEIVQRCHKTHIYHRNLHPNNIIAQHHNDHISVDEIKLVLIDFGLAWIDSQELSINDEDDLKMINQVNQRHSTSNIKQSSNHTFDTLQHLLSLSAKSQRCSPIIDVIGVGRIFFWLLTDKWLDQVQYTAQSHYQNEYQQKINEKLGKIIRVLICSLQMSLHIHYRRRAKQYKIT